MRYLVYCVLRSLKTHGPKDLVGVDDQPVFFISDNGLSAAASEVNASRLTSHISRLLAYGKVIESLHHDPAVLGVIPMRYGCVVDERSQIMTFVEQHRKQYMAVLKELEGCVEMGIRVLISDFGPPSPSRDRDGIGRRDSSVKCPNADKGLEGEFGRLGPSITSLGQGMRRPAPWGLGPGGNAERGSQKLRIPPSALHNPQSDTPGKTYLTERKAHYAQRERITNEMNIVVDRYRNAFAGLFVKCTSEHHTFGNPQLVSVYFLVPKDSLNRFREVFRQIDIRESEKLLLSGPWPPYSFVQPEHSEGGI